MRRSNGGAATARRRMYCVLTLASTLSTNLSSPQHLRPISMTPTSTHFTMQSSFVLKLLAGLLQASVTRRGSGPAQPKAYTPSPKAYTPKPTAYAPAPKQYVSKPKAYVTAPKVYAPKPKVYQSAPKGINPSQRCTSPTRIRPSHRCTKPRRIPPQSKANADPFIECQSSIWNRIRNYISQIEYYFMPLLLEALCSTVSA